MHSASNDKGYLAEFFYRGRLHPAVVLGGQGNRVRLLDADGKERMVARELVLIHHRDRPCERATASEALESLERQRSRLASELDLNLLWEVVQEQGRSFHAGELADLFFGQRSGPARSVMLEALLADRVYFVRRHMEFVARPPDQVERLQVQQDKIRARSEEYRHRQKLMRDIMAGAAIPPAEDLRPIIDDLTRYLENPFARDRAVSSMLASLGAEIDAAECAYEILDRLGATPPGGRFAVVGGLRIDFPPEVLAEAAAASPAPREPIVCADVVTIDDSDTAEVDDAVSCDVNPDGTLTVRIHIALVADVVSKDSAVDREAARRATSVYLPETTVRMLPEAIGCGSASLVAGQDRSVLTTEVKLRPDGEILDSSIYPARVRISRRLDYEEVERILEDCTRRDPTALMLRRLRSVAIELRERRRRAGAAMIERREPKVRIRDGKIEVRVFENSSPSRILVSELMVLSNFVSARFAAHRHVPVIYRVKPESGGQSPLERPRLSLYPEHHSGVGLEFYAQLSSPLRRYADLVLQRQIVAALAAPPRQAYSSDELLGVLASAESAELSSRERERRARRYWILRLLADRSNDRPLRALVTREGAGAELFDYAIRGTLSGAPALANGSPIVVRIGRCDPLRGWLSMDYVAPDSGAATKA